MSLSKDEQKILEHSGYRFVGQYGHAACKICHWTRESIVNRGVCYKEKFYGIESHRCLQMSPAVPFCQQKCSFCWRDLSLTKTEWTGQYDDVETIIDEAIEAHNLLLCGYYGNDNADKKKLEELKHPNNAAISAACIVKNTSLIVTYFFCSNRRSTVCTIGAVKVLSINYFSS